MNNGSSQRLLHYCQW